MGRKRSYDEYMDDREYDRKDRSVRGRRSQDRYGGERYGEGHYVAPPDRKKEVVADQRVKKPLLCPRCGRQMELITIKGQPAYYVCKQDDMKASLQIKNGKVMIKGTPADRKTRWLRREIHKCFNLIVDGNIMSYKTLIQYLSMHLYGHAEPDFHVGSMDEQQCMNILGEVKKLLDEHGIEHTIEYNPLK